MKKQILFVFTLVSLLLTNVSFSQNTTALSVSKKVSKLFRNQEVLPIKLSYSNRYIKRETNDSTYAKISLTYQEKDSTWRSLDVEIRSRGNFRLENCFYTPIKLKIKKSVAKGTIFKGNKKLKLVLPCKTDKQSNDNVIKEFLAYKFYEIISPYNFKTRLVFVEFDDIKNKKNKKHYLKGFLIEDDKEVLDRYDAKLLKRPIHPQEQEPSICVRHAFFQYLIGNTDFSTVYQHNVKLLYKDNNMFPVPYDFDMSGLVNPSYASISKAHLEKMNIRSVTVRKYRGFKRDLSIYTLVQQEYLQKKTQIMQCISDAKLLFDNMKEYDRTINYVNDFFKTLENNDEFNKEIVNKARD